MKFDLEYTTDYGYFRARLFWRCDDERFYDVANILVQKLKAKFINEVADFDSLYWDFLFREHTYTLHYYSGLGIFIYSTNVGKATNEENETVKKIVEYIVNNWEKLDDPYSIKKI